MANTELIDDWINLLIEAVEAAGPQRLEVSGKTPMMVLPLDTYRTLVGDRPSFVEMMRNFGQPDSKLPGEQAPFNVAGHPVPTKY